MTPSPQSDFVCANSYNARSACKEEPFFRKHEGKDYCVLHYPGKDKIEVFRTSLQRKLHVGDFDFREVWFPEAINFKGLTFNSPARFDGSIFNAHVRFSHTIFNALANFDDARFVEEASFFKAEFKEDARFHRATFETANFDYAAFGVEARFFDSTFRADTSFFSTVFSGHALFEKAKFKAKASFYHSSFNEDTSFDKAIFTANVSFDHAIFKAVVTFDQTTFNAEGDFYNATFNNYVRFSRSEEKRNLGENPRLSFQFAHVEKPERFSFHSLDLRPHWFVNVDSRKFEFTDVEFKYVLKNELKSLEEMRVSAPHRLLAVAFRQLADNAETNHRYREASRLRYSAFEVRRIEKSHGAYFWQMDWWRRQASCYKESLELTFSGFVPWRLDWWYWLASGYGESVGRAFIVFTLLISLFAFGYKSAEFEPPNKPDNQATAPPPRSWSEAMRYSVNVALLQKPEPKPRGGWGWLVTAETVLGPAQAALLALALRRRFMR